MKNVLEIIRRNKVESIILKFIIIIVLLITVVLNSETYREVFQDENLIFNKKQLDSVIKKNRKFVTLNMKDAELVTYSLKNTQTGLKEINVYKIIYNDEIFLAFLRNNTAITDKVKGEITNFSDEMIEIKEKLMEENPDKNINKMCFSNVNYNVTEKIIKIKFIFSTILFCIITITIFFDVYYLINPKRTTKYKKYVKNKEK